MKSNRNEYLRRSEEVKEQGRVVGGASDGGVRRMMLVKVYDGVTEVS